MTIGFTPAAIAFYEGLESDNSRDWWLAHKAEWEREVREPMAELTDALAEEFGEAKLFRPNRDVRFSLDKSPYKTHQGAFVSAQQGIGFYVEISADGLRTGGGFRAHSGGQTQRMRRAIDADHTGGELISLLESLRASGYEVVSDHVRTTPKGYRADHPRIEALRFKDLMLITAHGAPAWLGTERVLDAVATSWRQVRPLVEWATAHVGRP